MRLQTKRYEMVEEHFRSIVKFQNNQKVPTQDIDGKTSSQIPENDSSTINATTSNENEYRPHSSHQHELHDGNKKYKGRKRPSGEIPEDVIQKKKQLIGNFCYYLNYNSNDYEKCTVINYNSDFKKFRIVTANK